MSMLSAVPFHPSDSEYGTGERERGTSLFFSSAGVTRTVVHESIKGRLELEDDWMLTFAFEEKACVFSSTHNHI